MLGRRVTIILTVLYAAVLVWLLAAGYVSYRAWGPAIAIALLIVILFVGLVTNWLQDQDPFGRVPRVIGLEHLVYRLSSFKKELNDLDREIIFEHTKIVLSIAQTEFNNREMRLCRAFLGTKMSAGVFLLHPSGLPQIVLKLDSMDNIDSELKLYTHCVQQSLTKTPGEPRKRKHARATISGKEWGAITYNLVDADESQLEHLQTFGEYFCKLQDKTRLEAGIQTILDTIRPFWHDPHPQDE